MWAITGGSGFIGSRLGSRIAEHQIPFAILDRRESPLFPDRVRRVDICDLDALRGALAGEVIVHLAAEHRDDIRPPSRYDEVNVGGTANVAQVAREKGIDRIVFTSTVAVYGFAPPGTGEAGAIRPFNAYGRTKFEAEEVLRCWQAEAPERRALTIVRPTVVFGPGNRGNVHNLLTFIRSGRFVMVGDGRNRKSMAYVENVAAFLHRAAQFGPGLRVFNYVDLPDLTMNDLVGQVRQRLLGKPGVGPRLPRWLGLGIGHLADGAAALSGRSLPISALRVRKFTATTSFASAAHDVAGFKAPKTLAEGLDLTLEHDFLHPDPAAPVFHTE